MCHDLELAVPGTYDPNKPVVRIAKVDSALQVAAKMSFENVRFVLFFRSFVSPRSFVSLSTNVTFSGVVVDA